MEKVLSHEGSSMRSIDPVAEGNTVRTLVYIHLNRQTFRESEKHKKVSYYYVESTYSFPSKIHLVRQSVAITRHLFLESKSRNLFLFFILVLDKKREKTGSLLSRTSSYQDFSPINKKRRE